ncbi:hypothetical protein EJ02DRAFT_513171 [Clathrospora elynae]|uniref:Uncharacterized protein n=1 Tax=Clathrospora elynae TaxID=706981 RepID=A0A6A5SLM3_9PLEO|nr:hypothetical protein EJ02DRAFT_513171 [Clathrospora elynae]
MALSLLLLSLPYWLVDTGHAIERSCGTKMLNFLLSGSLLLLSSMGGSRLGLVEPEWVMTALPIVTELAISLYEKETACVGTIAVVFVSPALCEVLPSFLERLVLVRASRLLAPLAERFAAPDIDPILATELKFLRRLHRLNIPRHLPCEQPRPGRRRSTIRLKLVAPIDAPIDAHPVRHQNALCRGTGVGTVQEEGFMAELSRVTPCTMANTLDVFLAPMPFGSDIEGKRWTPSIGSGAPGEKSAAPTLGLNGRLLTTVLLLKDVLKTMLFELRPEKAFRLAVVLLLIEEPSIVFQGI